LIGKTLKEIVPIQIDGAPTYEERNQEEISKNDIRGCIMVNIQTRDGLQIRKMNLSYQELKQLVEKLEGLC